MNDAFREASHGAGSAGRADWERAAAAVLRKSRKLADDQPDDTVWDALARTTVDGLTIPPLGIAGEHGTAAARPLTGRAAPGWDVRARIDDPNPATAHAHAIGNLEGGATSLCLAVGDHGTSIPDIPDVLHGVHLGMAPVVLDHSHPGLGDNGVYDGTRWADESLAAAGALVGLADSTSPLHPDCSLGIDPLGSATRHIVGEPLNAAPDRAGQTIAETARALERLPHAASLASRHQVRAVTVDASVVHNAGAGDITELAYSLAAGVAYLRALTAGGIDINAACRLIDFRYAVTDHQPTSIAKLRAARLLWQRVCELSGAEQPEQYQHAVTSGPMMTRYDRHVNLLRTTVAAFAAGVGGADAVTVIPFDAATGAPDEFSHRMARNISALLMGESGLADVADPTGGAHAIEALTAATAEAAWQQFGEIESEGGILSAPAGGTLVGHITSARAERDRRIANRRWPITGVSEYPRADEELATRAPGRTTHSDVHTWAETFEQMRDDPPEQPILLLRIGSEAAASARVQFARNLLTAGGIRITEHADDAAALSGDGPWRAAIIAGADVDYREHLAATIASLRQAATANIFLAGRPRDVLGQLGDGAVTGTIAASDDIITFLSAVRTALGGTR